MLRISVEAQANPADYEWINTRLKEHAKRSIGPMEHAALTVFLRDEGNQLQGGLLGWTVWSWLHIDTLWVEEHKRGHGHGRRLLEAAERIAISRGCTIADLETFDAAACKFYVKAGFTVIGSVKEVYGRFERYYLSKRLTEGPQIRRAE